MKSQIFKILALFSVIILTPFNSYSQNFNLRIEITGISTIKGELYVAIYNNEKDFQSKTAFKSKRIKVKKTEEILSFSLPQGTYAITLYQDINNNKKLDSMFSIPFEPYGVSNNFSGFPSFKKAKFSLLKDQSIKIKIKN